MNTTGERLAYVRKLRGYTQASLANAIDVSRGVISNIEYGQNDPLPVVAEAICSKLGINKDWLLSGVGEMNSNTHDRILAELYEVCSHLSEAEQLYIIDVIHSMQKHQVIEHKTNALDDLIGNTKSRTTEAKPPGKEHER